MPPDELPDRRGGWKGWGEGSHLSVISLLFLRKRPKECKGVGNQKTTLRSCGRPTCNKGISYTCSLYGVYLPRASGSQCNRKEIFDRIPDFLLSSYLGPLPFPPLPASFVICERQCHPISESFFSVYSRHMLAFTRQQGVTVIDLKSDDSKKSWYSSSPSLFHACNWRGYIINKKSVKSNVLYVLGENWRWIFHLKPQNYISLETFHLF